MSNRQEAKPILACSPSATLRMHLLLPLHSRSCSMNNTLREAAIFDEPISGPSKQTVIQLPIGRKGKNRKRSKKSLPTIAMQPVASNTATRHSLAQAIDSTDELEPVQPHTPDVQLAARSVNWEKPSLTPAQV